ncbi:hypothetical protein D3C85_1192990 [compost metagenome]
MSLHIGVENRQPFQGARAQLIRQTFDFLGSIRIHRHQPVTSRPQYRKIAPCVLVGADAGNPLTSGQEVHRQKTIMTIYVDIECFI